ncbi:MAG: hypothetical protein RL367_2026 [Pseudomonadota bacterium]
MSAVFSRCGRYRYRLDRILGPGIKAAYIGVNPSRADATSNDPTIRKLIGFAPGLGVGHWMVGNVFGFAATDIAALRDCDDPVGPGNARHLRAMLIEADLVVIGWGTLGKLPAGLRDEHRRLLGMATRLRRDLHCWGVTGDQQPRHPLMLAYRTELERWSDAVQMVRPLGQE